MERRRLGKTGIVVSEICMGTMTFGLKLDQKESFRIMDRSTEAGINFFDTAEVYPVPPTKEDAGRTEEIVGEWMSNRSRESVIIATKVAGAAHGWFNPPVRDDNAALDRVHIRKAVEGSLRRLKTDYIDLYQVHWPDHGMRAEDTLEALDEMVREGKIRAIGCSNESAYGLMKGLWASELHGLSRYETIQNNFSLNNRRFEDELADCCRREQVSLIPYAPLAGGVLTGKYNDEEWPEGARYTEYKNVGPRQAEMAYSYVNDQTREITRHWLGMAKELDIHPATFGTAWSKQNDFVASTIVGVSAESQLDPIFAAAGLTLPDEMMERIDQVCREITYPMG